MQDHLAICLLYMQRQRRCCQKPCMTAGAGAVKGNLRALNQSVSSQVATLMKDPTKLTRRTGIPAEQRPRVLCHPGRTLAEPAASPESGIGLHGSTPARLASSAEEEELDLEAYDDGEFYAQLLKEFLDSSSGANNLLGTGLYPQVRQRRRKAQAQSNQKGCLPLLLRVRSRCS